MTTWIKRFGDYQVEAIEVFSDDEFQSKIEYQANTVALNTMPYSLYIVGAVLAWCIPGVRSLLSLLVFIPLLLGISWGHRWMKYYAPRPRPAILMRSLIPQLLLGLVQALGIAYQMSSQMGKEDSVLNLVFGSTAGLTIGAIAGLWLMRSRMVRKRQADQHRLESELED